MIIKESQFKFAALKNIMSTDQKLILVISFFIAVIIVMFISDLTEVINI